MLRELIIDSWSIYTKWGIIWNYNNQPMENKNHIFNTYIINKMCHVPPFLVHHRVPPTLSARLGGQRRTVNLAVRHVHALACLKGNVCMSLFNIPSGKQTVCYWKWPFIVDLPTTNGDFPTVMLVYQRVAFGKLTDVCHGEWSIYSWFTY